MSVDWLLGGFYTRENTDYARSLLVIDPAAGAELSNLTDISYHHLTDLLRSICGERG